MHEVGVRHNSTTKARLLFMIMNTDALEVSSQLIKHSVLYNPNFQRTFYLSAILSLGSPKPRLDIDNAHPSSRLIGFPSVMWIAIFSRVTSSPHIRVRFNWWSEVTAIKQTTEPLVIMVGVVRDGMTAGLVANRRRC